MLSPVNVKAITKMASTTVGILSSVSDLRTNKKKKAAPTGISSNSFLNKIIKVHAWWRKGEGGRTITIRFGFTPGDYVIEWYDDSFKVTGIVNDVDELPTTQELLKMARERIAKEIDDGCLY